MGGTEATVVRVADGLAARGHAVSVLQEARTEALGHYLPLSSPVQDQIDLFVGLRIPRSVSILRATFGQHIPTVLWMHDFNHEQIADAMTHPGMERVTLVGVSRTHQMLIRDALLRRHVVAETDYIYNPVTVDHDAVELDGRKLIYFSSAHKGLNQTVKMFTKCRLAEAGFKLYVANPGYYESERIDVDGVETLGSLAHHEVMAQVASSFAVFHMNEYPETFGLVYAEAKALQTAVLTSNVPALPEVLGTDLPYYVDIRDSRSIVDALAWWERVRPPIPPINSKMQLDQVLDRWEQLLPHSRSVSA